MKKLIWSVIASVLTGLTMLAGAAAATTVSIGVNMELSGYSGDPGTEQLRGILTAHRLAPEVTVHGVTYAIKILPCDNQTIRQASVNCAADLIDQGVVGILGGYSSSMTIASAEVAQNEGVVQISTGGTNPAVTALGDYIFRTVFTDDYQGHALAGYASDVLGAQRAAVFVQEGDVYSEGLAEVFRQAFERSGGHAELYLLGEGTDDFTAQLENARSFEPDVLVTTSFCPYAGPLVRQSRTAGFEQPWLGGDAVDSPTCIELSGVDFDGVRFTSFPDLVQLEPQALARAGAMQRAYAELYPGTRGFGGTTLAGSDAYGVLREAIRLALEAGADAEDITAFRTSVREALASLADYEGVTGLITYAGTDGTPSRRSIGLLEVEILDDHGRYERVSKGYFVIEPPGTVYYPAW